MCIDLETCDRQPDSWVIGYYEYDKPNPWFLVREGGGVPTQHRTHNEAMRYAQDEDPNVEMFHEADGGGCLGSFDESPYDHEDNCY